MQWYFCAVWQLCLWSSVSCTHKKSSYLYFTHVLPATLTHWGRVTHIRVSKLNITGSDNGLPPGRRQAIIWTNAGILFIRTLITNFSEIKRKLHAFSFKKMNLKMPSAKWRTFCLGLNVLMIPMRYVTKYEYQTHFHSTSLWNTKWSYMKCSVTTINVVPKRGVICYLFY